MSLQPTKERNLIKETELNDCKLLSAVKENYSELQKTRKVTARRDYQLERSEKCYLKNQHLY